MCTIAQSKQIKVIFSAAIDFLEVYEMKKLSKPKELFFSIELTSKNHLKNVTLTNGNPDNALVEGTIGELLTASFADEEILEVIGKKGIFRINLALTDINQAKEKSAGTRKQ